MLRATDGARGISRMQTSVGAAIILAAALGLAACSGQPDKKDGQLLGYGTPGVSAYVQGDQAGSLQAQLDRCGQVPQASTATQTQGLAAACGQLQRMLRNQPGNSVQPAGAQRDEVGTTR